MEYAGLPVVGYPRVSTDDQALFGSSLSDDQPVKIRSIAARYGLDLVDMIPDAGESSKSLDRPGIQRVLAMLRAGSARGIVVAYLDRLTRHVGDMVHLVDTYFTEPGGPILFDDSGPVQTRTAGGRLQLYIMIVVSQYVRETIVERTAGAMVGKRSRSERRGNIRFGETTDAGDGRRSKAGNPIAMVACEEDLRILEIIKASRTAGLSLREIASSLNAMGIPSKRGITKRSTGLWSHSSVQKILKRFEA